MRKTILFLAFPITVSAQVTLTPMEVRRANVLLDNCDRMADELTDCSAEVVAWQDAFVASEAARLIAEAQIKDGTALADEYAKRELVLIKAIGKSGQATKRRERLLWIVGTIAAVEAVAIGVAYGVR